MTLLILFAFLAGIVTVLSPCVLPVLPALLSAGGGKGHLRPIGIILGLIFSFTFFTLALTAIVQATGISPDFLRYIAIALIAGFGLLMIFPSLGEKFAEATSGIANFGQTVSAKSRDLGTGFTSGFVLGMALGLVWTPCAGPILAAITTLVATSSVSFAAFFITLAYSLGAAIPMFFIIYGGQKIVNSSRSLSKYAETIRKGFGVLMILSAIAIAFHYDVKLQQFAIQYVPFVNIENNDAVKNELQKLREDSSNKAFILPTKKSDLKDGTVLPKLAAAPDLKGITGWINSKPLELKDLRGKVVLIDFWTYSCINCIRTLPYLKSWYEQYKDKGFVIIGVHTPEFEFEKNPKNIEEAVKRFGITYPVAIDSNFQTWQNYNNQFWPAHYLIDQDGFVRSFHFGEGAYMETENDIRSLLGLPPTGKEEVKMAHRELTPETYLGSLRGGKDEVALRNKWMILPEKITAKDDMSELDLNVLATQVYLVMDAQDGHADKLVTVFLDDKPLDKKYWTADMNDKGQIMVKEARKYDVIDLKGDYGHHKLTLGVPQGVSLYAFTFGDEPR